MSEQWKPVPGYEDHYEVSDLGNARRIGNEKKNTFHHRPLKPHIARHGYKRFALSVARKVNGVKHWSCHRMVWETFNGPIPPDLQINHINGVVDDNRLTNLELATPSQNKLHSIHILKRTPKRPPPGTSLGSKNPRAKITESDLPMIRSLIDCGYSDQKIANRYGVCNATIWHIRKGNTWKHV